MIKHGYICVMKVLIFFFLKSIHTHNIYAYMHASRQNAERIKKGNDDDHIWWWMDTHT